MIIYKRLIKIVLILTVLIPFANAKYSHEHLRDTYNKLAISWVKSEFSKAKTIGDLYSEKLHLNKKDKEFIERLMQTVGKSKMPKYSVEGNRVVVESKNEKMQIEVIDVLVGKFKVNGHDLDFNKYPTFESQYKFIERVGNLSTTDFKFYNESIVKKIYRFTTVSYRAEAALPFVVAGIFMVGGVSSAGYQACNHQVVLCKKDQHLAANIASIKRYVELNSNGIVNMTIRCKKPRELTLTQVGSELPFYSNLNNEVEKNIDTHAMSYSSLKSDFNQCCDADEAYCEAALRSELQKNNSNSESGENNTHDQPLNSTR